MRVAREIFDSEARLSWVLAVLAGVLGATAFTHSDGYFVTFEPLGAGGDPYPAMYGKPDAATLDHLVHTSIKYFRECEDAVLAE